MPSMPGPMELLIVAALALIVFGPARLPEIARSIGKAVNEFRRQASDLKSEFDLSLDEEDEAPAHVKPGKAAAQEKTEAAPAEAAQVDEAAVAEGAATEEIRPDVSPTAEIAPDGTVATDDPDKS